MTLASDLLVTMEFASLLLVSIFFSMIYELNRHLTWSGIIASMTWIVLGMFYLLVYGQYSTQSISLFFTGIGIIYVVRWMIDLISMRNLGRRLVGETDEY